MAYKLSISYKEALKLKQIYLQSEVVAEKIQRSDPEITAYYEKEISQQEQKEAVERLIKNAMEQRKGVLDCVEIGKRRDLILSFIPDSIEIFFVADNSHSVVRWVIKEAFQSHSPTFYTLRFSVRLN